MIITILSKPPKTKGHLHFSKGGHTNNNIEYSTCQLQAPQYPFEWD